MVEYVWEDWGMKVVEGPERIFWTFQWQLAGRIIGASRAVGEEWSCGRPFKIRIKNGPRAGDEARAGADWLDPEISSWW